MKNIFTSSWHRISSFHMESSVLLRWWSRGCKSSWVGRRTLQCQSSLCQPSLHDCSAGCVVPVDSAATGMQVYSPDTSATQKWERKEGRAAKLWKGEDGNWYGICERILFFPKRYHSQPGFPELSILPSSGTAKHLLCLHIEPSLSTPLCKGQFYIVHSLDHSWLISIGKSKFSRLQD